MLKNMFERIGGALTTTHIRVTGEVRAIKSDERAMEVIQVVMLIAVGVLAIAAVWAGVNGLLEDLWEVITGGAAPQPGPDLGD